MPPTDPRPRTIDELTEVDWHGVASDLAPETYAEWEAVVARHTHATPASPPPTDHTAALRMALPDRDTLIRWLDSAIGHADEFRVTQVGVHSDMLRLTREYLLASQADDPSGPDATDVEPSPPGTLLAELDACKPLMNGTGPAQGGRTFSGWEVPHWLMLRVRAALRESSDGD